jgi:hypothetical protein
MKIGGEEGAVDRADRGAEDNIGRDRALGEGPQHSDLMPAEDPASAQHDGNF